MAAKLYIVHGSHPCATVAKALEIKGIPFKIVELPPPMHIPVQRFTFHKRTVPAVRFADGEKLAGSRELLARLDEMVPEPALLPADPDARAAVLEAERWGEEVLQPLARRVVWPTLKEHPEAAPSYTATSKIPFPAPLLKLSMPWIARIEMRVNKASNATRDADFAALGAHIDRIDAWLADGTLGAKPTPNRADLQIGSSLALLATFGDVRDRFGSRPAFQLAELFSIDGSMPSGTVSIPA